MVSSGYAAMLPDPIGSARKLLKTNLEAFGAAIAGYIDGDYHE